MFDIIIFGWGCVKALSYFTRGNEKWYKLNRKGFDNKYSITFTLWHKNPTYKILSQIYTSEYEKTLKYIKCTKAFIKTLFVKAKYYK